MEHTFGSALKTTVITPSVVVASYLRIVAPTVPILEMFTTGISVLTIPEIVKTWVALPGTVCTAFDAAIVTCVGAEAETTSWRHDALVDPDATF